MANADRIRTMIGTELEGFLRKYIEPYKVCASGKELNEFKAAVLRDSTVGGYGRADDGEMDNR